MFSHPGATYPLLRLGSNGLNGVRAHAAARSSSLVSATPPVTSRRVHSTVIAPDRSFQRLLFRKSPAEETVRPLVQVLYAGGSSGQLSPNFNAGHRNCLGVPLLLHAAKDWQGLGRPVAGPAGGPFRDSARSDPGISAGILALPVPLPRRSRLPTLSGAGVRRRRSRSDPKRNRKPCPSPRSVSR